MRDTIDLGIDLGRTKSRAAICEGGEVSVVRNNDGEDATPSAIWMPKPNLTHVGRRAMERVDRDPGNAAAEFVLGLGQADARRDFVDAGVSRTPQEMVAEVLKSLRADAGHHLGGAPDAAVIAVPTAFGMNQHRATKEAATRAGFDAVCPLVPEPTAAAFAYGVHLSRDESSWVVVDFGGSHFDATVVNKRGEELRVLSHVDDPYLGGRTIDFAIAERILAPAASRSLGLEDFVRTNPAWSTDFAALVRRAEEAKIVLARRHSAVIDMKLPGTNELFEYTLHRDEVDSVAEPFYRGAVSLARRALVDAGLDADDIECVLLVGGVTLDQRLRDLLADEGDGLGIDLDGSLDPTVVVAQGAAIFASTIQRPRRTRTTVEGDDFVVDLTYQPRVTTTTTSVGVMVRMSAAVDSTAYAISLSNPNGRPPFHSGRIPVRTNRPFAIQVDLDESRCSTFTIELVDGTGSRCQIAPNTVTIAHGSSRGEVVLAHSVGVQLAGREFVPVLAKGTALPWLARMSYRTPGGVRRDTPESEVQIPVVQGESQWADRRQLGMVRIRSKDVPVDLPAGSDIEICFEVDEQHVLTVFADVPVIDLLFEMEVNLADVHPTEP